MDEERSTRAVLKKRSTDWTDWAFVLAYHPDATVRVRDLHQ